MGALLLALAAAPVLAVVYNEVPGTELPDVLRGTGGPDLITGLAGNDEIMGFGGKDLLEGGVDDDRVYGNGGNDKIVGGSGKDELRGGTGDDKIWAVDQQRDLGVHCGMGNKDIAMVDPQDAVSSTCEDEQVVNKK